MFHYEQIQKLNELELSVYNYVILHTDEMAAMKIRDLAAKTHVSTTTILRFCSKMDCSGYSEFKVKLKLHSQAEKQELSEDTYLMQHYFQKINTPDFVERVRHCSKVIAGSKNVLFYGIGSSGILGQYGARYFSNLGIYSSFIADPFYPSPNEISQNAFLMVLSVSGETSVMIQQVNGYKAKKFKIISITNSESSTLSKISDGTIGYDMPMEVLPKHQNITTQVPVVHIIETLGRAAQSLRN